MENGESYCFNWKIEYGAIDSGVILQLVWFSKSLRIFASSSAVFSASIKVISPGK